MEQPVDQRARQSFLLDCLVDHPDESWESPKVPRRSTGSRLHLLVGEG